MDIDGDQNWEAVSAPSRVAVYYIENNKRSARVAEAMTQGIRTSGEIAKIIPSQKFRGVEGKVAVFYGFDRTMQTIFREYRRAGLDVVYVDLGYWGRRHGGLYSGYHKVAINSRHPTGYFQTVTHDRARFSRFGLEIRDWQTEGRHILLAGMSGKAAAAEGYQPSEWERWAIETLKRFTDRQIIYRPKPSWAHARPLSGSTFSNGHDVPLDELLSDCHAVVTHHSNVAVDGLLHGVPVFSFAGAGSVLSLSDLSRIEDPWRPHSREQMFWDLAWTQWSQAEMQSGVAWRHLRREGLI